MSKLFTVIAVYPVQEGWHSHDTSTHLVAADDAIFAGNMMRAKVPGAETFIVSEVEGGSIWTGAGAIYCADLATYNDRLAAAGRPLASIYRNKGAA